MLLPYYQKQSKQIRLCARTNCQPRLISRALALAAIIALIPIFAVAPRTLLRSLTDGLPHLPATHYSSQDFADEIIPTPIPAPAIVFESLPIPSAVDSSTSPPDPAHLAVDALFARQSTTLAEATARYELRTNRAPPPHYDRWFRYAQERRCLIDEYDQIHRDFKPFYQLAERDPGFFAGMIERARRELEAKPAGICVIEIHDGVASSAGNCPTSYVDAWPITFAQFSQILPNMTFLISSRDEPRVAFNVRDPRALARALNWNANDASADSTPFHIAPRPTTAEFFATQSGCDVPLERDGFMRSVNDEHSFLLSTSEPGFTTDLYPMLSMAKISPCFADILFPTEYYYDRSWWSGKFAYPDVIYPWEDKKPLLYWRGTSTGGQIVGSNYHHFTRFKLAKLAAAHPELMDVAITGFADTLCHSDSDSNNSDHEGEERGCARATVMEEYNITGAGAPREGVYEFKYAMDVDGTSFSGRFLGLLRSGSLVFKATLFEEYFNDWLRPFEHYVPVKPDLSDLTQRIEWANTHPEEARAIQQRGMAVAKRVMTDEQNDCYFAAVLIEWGRLLGYAGDAEVGEGKGEGE